MYLNCETVLWFRRRKKIYYLIPAVGSFIDHIKKRGVGIPFDGTFLSKKYKRKKNENFVKKFTFP